MKQTRLRNSFLKHTYKTNKRAFNAQINNCVSLLKNRKKYYFDSPDHKKITDIKDFWKTVNSFFTNK